MTSNSLYTALPQSLSDSDSEKDVNDLQIPSTTIINRHAQNGHAYNYHSSKASESANPTIKQLPKMGFKSMSRTRKCLFITSILICFLTIILFLWVLPCNSTNYTCPSHITSWKIEHHGIEFKGKINIIRNEYKSSVQIALIAKRNLKGNDNQSGAMGLKTSNGEILWFIPQPSTPNELNCELIDINLDGIPDCLLLWDSLALEAFNPITTEYLWHAHTKKTTLTNLKFPVLIPDINHDGVSDLLSVSGRNKFLIISGKNGTILNEIAMRNCLEIDRFYYESSLLIYFCYKMNNEADYYKTTLISLLRNENSVRTAIDDTKTFILDHRRLFVENVGECPHCSTNITLIDERFNNKILFNWNYENTFTMTPVSFAFKPNQHNLKKFKGYVNGFIIKFWEFPKILQERNNLTERIVLITFNETIENVINVSYAQLLQLCFKNGDCQPDILNKNESLLVSDLDYDGAQEIITYSTSYKCDDEGEDLKGKMMMSSNEEPCVLISKVEVIRLEDELPKFYNK